MLPCGHDRLDPPASRVLLYRMPWHIEDPTPTGAAMLGLLLGMCGTTIAGEDRGIDLAVAAVMAHARAAELAHVPSVQVF